MHAARTIELPVAALVSVLYAEDVAGEPHAILAGPEEYAQRRYRDEARREVRAGLARAGVRMDGEFRDLLALIQRPSVECYGWVNSGVAKFGVLVAARGRAAVTLIRRGDRVTLSRADPDYPAMSLVSHLPGEPSGRGTSISVRVAEFTPPDSGTGGLMHRATAARSHDARRLDELLRRPRLGGARLYAATRDNSDRRHRAAEWLNVLDISHHGRWLVYITTGSGDRAVNAAPGTAALITTKLTELLRSVR